MNQLIAFGRCLYLLGWLSFAPTALANVSTELTFENDGLAEYEENDLSPLAQLPAWGLFCYTQYPLNLKGCLLVTTFFTQLRTLDRSYLSPHSDRFWYEAIFWVSVMVKAIGDNQVFDRRNFPALIKTMKLAIIIRTVEIGADTGVRILGYWPHIVKKNIYHLFKDCFNSIGTGLVVGSLFFLKPEVSMGYQLSVPVLISTAGMLSSIVVRNDSEINTDWLVVVIAAAVAAVVAGIGAGAGAVVVAEAGVRAGAVAFAGAVVGAVAGAIAVAVVGAVVGAGAVAEAGTVAGVVTGAGVGVIAAAAVVTGVGAGFLFCDAIEKIVLHDFSMQDSLPYDFLRLGGLFILSEGVLFTGQAVSYFNSGNTLSDSGLKIITDLRNRVYDNLGAHILFWPLMWHLLNISRPQ